MVTVRISSEAGPASPASPSPSPPSPSASFYDLSDDEEGGYNTITHAASGRGVKLLYSKSKVYVHPTASAKDNIPGFIALVQQKAPTPTSTSTAAVPEPPSSSSAAPAAPKASTLLLAWLAESSLGDAYSAYVKVDLSDATSPPKQTYLVPPPPTTVRHGSPLGTYAFAVPVSEIYSILVRPPSLGWWFGSLVINSRAGDSFPALFFHDSECQSTILQKKKRARESFNPFDEDGGLFWGGDEVLRWLKRYVHVERSGAEPSIYLVNPSTEDRAGFSTGLARSAVPAGANGRPASSGGEAVGAGLPTSPGGVSSPGARDGGMDPLTKALKEARWSFLEKLSQVTNFTRRTAQDVLENPRVPPQVRRLMKNPEVQTLQEEFDSARLYLARWAMGIAEQSEREKNQRVWRAKDVMELEESAVGEFEVLDFEASNVSLSERRKPVTLPEWNSFFDPHSGRLQLTRDEVLEKVFHGGLDAEDGVRKEAWMFLLGVYGWDTSADERRAIASSRRDEYIRLKGAWWGRLADGGGQGEQGEWWREQKARIEKDVHRTDRQISLFAGEDTPHPDPDSPFSDVGTNVHLEQMKDMLLTYNEYNTGLGYVQGMSDLLAPIYAVMQDDALAFWGFVGFMERMERNFLRDQSGMHQQLGVLNQLVELLDPTLYAHLQGADSTNFFFLFRMLLVWFKREFSWPDILRLWECLWTDFLSAHFHLFIASAILERHRDVIIDHLKYFDEVLKYVNDLAGTIELESTLVGAETLFVRFRRRVDAVALSTRVGADRAGLPPLGTKRVARGDVDGQTTAAATGIVGTGDAMPRKADHAVDDTDDTDNNHEHHEHNGPSHDQDDVDNDKDDDKDKGKSIGKGKARAKEPPPRPAPRTVVTISPELRALLSREVVRREGSMRGAGGGGGGGGGSGKGAGSGGSGDGGGVGGSGGG
ncbi:MAG: GTPase activating protein [Phylliscum demangeonii]|nr:MAG: GTPase activating protein [Phylliscum demangeonii]